MFKHQRISNKIKPFGIILIIFIKSYWICAQIVDDDNGPLSEVQTAIGLDAIIPCNLTTTPTDKVQLVIWYKEGIMQPIYSFDARGKPLNKAEHWYSEELFKNKAEFFYDSYPPALRITGVVKRDAGLYKCRVDFHKTPTRNWRINLTVLVPPTQLTILDTYGAAVTNSHVGPYREGAGINLTCLSSGGSPPPRVSWFREHALLNHSFQILPDGTVRNVLVLNKITRDDWNSIYTCQASNGHVVTPLSKTVKLDMELAPLFVRLQGLNHPIVAGSKTHVTCTSAGARPAPVIKWTKGGVPVLSATQSTSSDGNVTISELILIPEPEDNEKLVVCSVAGDLLDSRILDVRHAPIVSLNLGGPLDSNNLKKGSDVYLECDIKANPPSKKIEWYHNNQQLYSSRGIIISNQTLAIQGISKLSHGQYFCRATNIQGSVSSNEVFIDVKYPPICKSPSTIIRAAIKQTINITCEIDANPMQNLTYKWQFNNTLENLIDLPESNSEQNSSPLMLASISSKFSSSKSMAFTNTNTRSISMNKNQQNRDQTKTRNKNRMESFNFRKEEENNNNIRENLLSLQQKNANANDGNGDDGSSANLNFLSGKNYRQTASASVSESGTTTTTTSNTDDNSNWLKTFYGIQNNDNDNDNYNDYNMDIVEDDDDNDNGNDEIQEKNNGKYSSSSLSSSEPHTSMVYSNTIYKNHYDLNRKNNDKLKSITTITNHLSNNGNTNLPNRNKNFQSAQYHNHHQKSQQQQQQQQTPPKNVYHYYVENYESFGAISCIASNAIAETSEPCFYHIQPADFPDMVKNCTSFNATANSIQINCTPGYDGGIEQHFHVQIYDELNRQILYNTTYKYSEFIIKRLPSDSVFVIRVTSINLQGPSKQSFRLRARTLSAPLLRTASSTAVLVQLTPLLGALVGVMVTLILVAVCIVIFIKIRSKNSRHRSGGGVGVGVGGNCVGRRSGRGGSGRGGIDTTTADNDKGSAEPLSRNMGSHSSLDDKNPDVVPQENSDDEFHLEEKAFDRLNIESQRILYTPSNRLNSKMNSSTLVTSPSAALSSSFSKQYGGELSLTTNPSYGVYNTTTQRPPAQQRPIYTAPPALLSTRSPSNIYTRIPGRTYLPTSTSPTPPPLLPLSSSTSTTAYETRISPILSYPSSATSIVQNSPSPPPQPTCTMPLLNNNNNNHNNNHHYHQHQQNQQHHHLLHQQQSPLITQQSSLLMATGGGILGNYDDNS